jgi:hypothetical protein
MKEGIAETLARIDKMVARQDRIDALRQDHSIGLENVIDVCFNENINWILPEGAPPYKEQVKEMDLQHVLYSQIRKLGIFIDTGNYQNMAPLKRETQFVEFLEMIDKDDAKLILFIKDKRKLPYSRITRKLFEDAWPALASSWPNKEKKNEKNKGQVRDT